MKQKESLESRNKNSNFIIKLFNGEISLLLTFWVFGVGFHSIIRLINFYINSHYIEIMSQSNADLYIKIFYATSILLSLFFAICIWNSANKSNISRVTAITAQILAFVGLFSLFSDMYKNIGANEDVRIQQQITLTNLTLPKMIDENKRFDNLSLINRNIYHNYTLVTMNQKLFKEQEFVEDMWPILIQTVCNDPDSKKILEDNRFIYYTYKDLTNNLLTEIKIDLIDCN
jgi:hypothetical protein